VPLDFLAGTDARASNASSGRDRCLLPLAPTFLTLYQIEVDLLAAMISDPQVSHRTLRYHVSQRT